MSLPDVFAMLTEANRARDLAHDAKCVEEATAREMAIVAEMVPECPTCSLPPQDERNVRGH